MFRRVIQIVEIRMPSEALGNVSHDGTWREGDRYREGHAIHWTRVTQGSGSNSCQMCRMQSLGG